MTFYPLGPSVRWCVSFPGYGHSPVSLTQAAEGVSISCSHTTGGLNLWREDLGKKFLCFCWWSVLPRPDLHTITHQQQHRAFKDSFVSTWFKFYPKDLTNHRFQYCLEKQPSVAAIYLWCLCACAEEGEESFPWMDSAVEYAGLSSMLHISFEQAKSGIGLLLDSKLISFDKVGIKVKGWQEHQSDYMGRRAYFARRYGKSTVKHSEAHLEESREDQSTEDFSVRDRQPPYVSNSLTKPPTT